MALVGAVVGCSSLGVSPPSGSAPNAFPVLNAAFLKHAGRIAFPNVAVPSVEALGGAGTAPNSTAGGNDLEAAGVDVASGGPYDGMLASITAYLPTQVKLPGTASAPSSVFAPYLAPTNGSCLTVGILYADTGSGTTASLVAKDTCANTVLYSTPITSSFASTYVQQVVTPANIRVPVIKVLVYTSDTEPTASSTWNAYLYDFSTQAYDLVATRKGISTSLAGGTLWTSSIRSGPCPALPQISVVSSYLYDGANQTYAAIAPAFGGTTSTPLPTTSNSCFKSVAPPATYTFVLAHANDMWNVVSATAGPSPTPVPTSTPFLVTVANGGSGALPDGSGSVTFGAAALPYDAYVTLTYMPTAAASPPSANWTVTGPQLHVAFTPAHAASPGPTGRAAATATPTSSASATPAPGTLTISQKIPSSLKLGSTTMTEINVGSTATNILLAADSVATDHNAGAVFELAVLTKPFLKPLANIATLDMFNLVQDVKPPNCPAQANLGLRYWNFATKTWSAGAPPLAFVHPLVLFHGITSCVEETFPTDTIQSVQTEGGYDAVLGEDYDWTKTPDQIIPAIVSNINALGPFQHIDFMAHSYGSIISMGTAPQISTKSIDNMIFINGPLNGSFLQNPDFVNSYSLFWPLQFAVVDPVVAAHTFAAQFNTAAWRKAFMPNDPEVAGFRASLVKAPDAPIRVIKVASTQPFPLPSALGGNVTNLYTAINLGATPGPNDGIVGQTSALSSDVVGTANTVNLSNQAEIPSKTFPLISASTYHTTSVQDPSIDSLDIGNNLATVFSDSDYSSQMLPSLGDAYVVMKGVGSTHFLGFVDFANPGSTLTVDASSVPANLSINPTTVSTVTSLANATAANYFSVALASDSSPSLPFLDPTAFGYEPPTGVVQFDYTNNAGTVKDAYSLAYYLLPSNCSATSFPCLPPNGSALIPSTIRAPRAAPAKIPGLHAYFLPRRGVR